MSVAGTYFLYYFIVISTSLVVQFSETLRKTKFKKIGKIIFLLSIIIPVFIAGYRFDTGTDYFSYHKMYLNLTNNNLSVFELISNTRFEPGWVFLNVFVERIFGDPVYIFVISALLTWIFFFKAVYDHKDNVSIGISVLILLCTMYNLSFNTVRQSLAISIILLSIKPLLNKHFFKYLIMVILAASFHFTSLIFLPAYWIVNSKNKNIGLIKKGIIPILFIAMIIFIKPLLSFVSNFDVFSAYGSYDVDYDGFSFGSIILRSPVMLFILLNFKRLKLKNNPMHKIVILYFLGIILLQLGYFGPYISRIAHYFEVVQILIVGSIIKEVNNKYERFLYSFVVIIYYLGWLTYHYLVLGRSGTIPYEWIL